MDAKYLFETASNADQELANGFARSREVSGARAATGTLTFGVNPTAGHTLTINGSVWTFHASTTDVAARTVKVEADLGTTLTTLVASLNASAVAAVAKATYVKTSGTVVTVNFDKKGPLGNAFTLATSNGNVTLSAAALAGGNKGDLLEKANTFLITTDAGAAEYFDLQDGGEGQEIAVILAVKGAGANAVINGNFAGGTTLTLDTADKHAVLKFLHGKWRPVVNTGTIA